MVIAFRDAKTGSANGGSSVAVTKPTGTATDDLLIAIVRNRARPNAASLSGWTVIRTDRVGTGAADDGISTLLYRVAGASEGASYTFSYFVDDGGNDVEAHVLGFSGCSVTAPIDTHGGTGTASSLVMPTLTPSVANAWLLGFWSTNTAGAASTFTYPGGMTNRSDTNVRAHIGVCTEARTDTSATGTRTTTESPSNGRQIAQGVLIAPVLPPPMPRRGPVVSQAVPRAALR